MNDATTPDQADTGDVPPSRAGRLLLVVIVLALVLALDLGTKAWAWEHVRGHSRRIIDGLLHFEFGFNTGSAFGMFRGQAWARVAFITITTVALAALGRLVMLMSTRHASSFVAAGLLAGGALGNLYDRLFRTLGTRHGVVDFIVVFYWPGRRWPSFNIADAALLAGVLLFLIYLSRHGELYPQPSSRDDRDTLPAG